MLVRVQLLPLIKSSLKMLNGNSNRSKLTRDIPCMYVCTCLGMKDTFVRNVAEISSLCKCVSNSCSTVK